MIYFTSDLHFCHSRDFIYEPRGFKSAYSMTDKIAENIINTVKWDDDLYILGDIMLNNNDYGIKVLKQLPGKKHIVIGNHDTEKRVELYQDVYNTEVIGVATIMKYKGWSFYLSHYPTMLGSGAKCRKQKRFCLCGHTHTKNKYVDMPYGCYHVDVDAHDCFPVSADQVIEDILKAPL